MPIAKDFAASSAVMLSQENSKLNVALAAMTSTAIIFPFGISMLYSLECPFLAFFCARGKKNRFFLFHFVHINVVLEWFSDRHLKLLRIETVVYLHNN
jgi:hypothetical protein